MIDSEKILEKFKEMTSKVDFNNISGEYKEDFNLSPSSGSVDGIGLCLHINSHDTWDNTLGKDLPTDEKNSPIVISLTLLLKSADQADMAIETLGGIKAMFLDTAKAMLGGDLDIQFRKGEKDGVVDSVIVDIFFKHEKSDEIIAHIKEMSLPDKLVQMNGEGHIKSAVTFTDVMGGDLENLITKGTRLTINGRGIMANKNLLKNIGSVILSSGKKRKAPIGILLTVLAAFELLEFKFNYDPETIKNLVISAINMENGEKFNEMKEMCKQTVDGMTMQAKGMVEGFKQFLEPFNGLIQAVNFDKIILTGNLPYIKYGLKIPIHLPGITEIINSMLFE